MSRVHLPVLLVALLIAGCADRADSDRAATDTSATAAGVSVETKADSVAMGMVEAMGGPQAWRSLPYLRFDFGFGQDGQRQTVARHLWDRQSGRYRVEWQTAPDSSYVARFNAQTFVPDAPSGTAYLNGTALDAAAATEALAQGYRRYINDAYWLLAPTKLFDEGVNRAYAADSSTAETDVLHVTFGDVGLTPGDEYWLYADKESGRLERWAFHLESMPADAPAAVFDWAGYQTMSAPTGDVQVATRKETAGRTIYTDRVAAPQQVPDSLFNAAEAVL